LKLTYPSGWTSGEDSSGEFSISSPRDPDLRVIFWKDVYPTVRGHGLARVKGVASMSQPLLSWLRANQNLTVGKSKSAKIGALPATAFDVSLSPRAANDDPHCPFRACVNFLGWPKWGEPYGLAGAAVTQFYLADVKQGTETHLLVAAIEATSAAALDAQIKDAVAIIASVKLPVAPA
jgi:hypothetical protein